MLAIRLPSEIEARLAHLAQETGRTKTFYAREAILTHLEELEDYYLAERVGGHPADMGWETQAVMLVPQEQLPQWLNSSYDTPIIEALKHV